MNRNDEILRVAMELQERDQALRERDRDLEEKAKAASEVGLDPAYIARATGIVDARIAAVPTQPQKPRSTVMIAIAAGAGLIAAGLTATLLPWSAPPEPWKYGFETQSYVLDKNPETQASVSAVEMPGHGKVAVLHVDRFVPAADGAWRANLEVTDVPDLSDFTEVRVAVRGDLPVARLYLDNGAERWRSGPIAVRDDWTPSWVKFSAMDHQVRKDGKWTTVDWAAPGKVSAISLKTGTFMNDEQATGDLMVDDLELR